MTILLTIVHILVCVFLVIVVLLQSGKAADLAGAFGGMGSQTAFGPRGSATILSKATTIAAALFMVTSLTLAIFATRSSGVGSTVLDRRPARATQSAPLPATPRNVPPSAPVVPGTAGAPAGPPSMTVTQPGGKPVTVPLNLPPQPQGTPAVPAQQPATPPKK
jgi:preprotein translocase subunit SecG